LLKTDDNDLKNRKEDSTDVDKLLKMPKKEEVIEIGEEEKKILKENNIEVGIKGNGIRVTSTMNHLEQVLINNKTLKDIAENCEIVQIEVPISQEEIRNLKYLNPLNSIMLSMKKASFRKEYLQNCKDFLKQLSKMNNQKFKVFIQVETFKFIEESKILEESFPNIDFGVSVDGNTYNFETLKEIDQKLEELVKPILDANLSPFEKYLATYNIAKNYKEYYNYNNESLYKKGDMSYILDKDSPYMVCHDSAILLDFLLGKVGIPSKNIGLDVDVSYDDGFTKEDKSVEGVGHARNIVKIDDDKYNIHGYYLADSTWDNTMTRDLYLNALMTFNRKKESFRLEWLDKDDTDLLFDFNSKEEFDEKINYLYRKIKDSEKYNKKNTSKVVYKKIFIKLLELLQNFDYEEYTKLYNKYYDKIFSNDVNEEQVEFFMNQLMDEYEEYILPLSNQEVSLDTILQAATVVQKEVNDNTNETLEEWKEKTFEVNKKNEIKYYPYQYNPNKTGEYIGIREEKEKELEEMLSEKNEVTTTDEKKTTVNER